MGLKGNFLLYGAYGYTGKLITRYANQFGLVGAEANAIVPEKRMLSSMSPTIIEKDGELFMTVGINHL